MNNDHAPAADAFLPCPFCGNTDSVLISEDSAPFQWAVVCSVNHGSKRGCGGASGWASSKAQAVAQWQSRAQVVPAEPVADAEREWPPKHSLPDWSECDMRVHNSDFFAKRVAEGGYGPEPDVKLATELHRFIHEYDDADLFRSAWFMHRLERMLAEVRSLAAPAASEPAEPAMNRDRWHVIPIDDRPSFCDRGASDECCGNGCCSQDKDIERAKASWIAYDAAQSTPVASEQAEIGDEMLDRLDCDLQACQVQGLFNARDTAFLRSLLRTAAPAEPTAEMSDSAMIEWLARAGDVSMGLIHDAPGDGNYRVDHDLGKSGEGKTFRDAVRAAMKGTAPTPPVAPAKETK